MNGLLQQIVLVFIGFSSGVVISGGVFSFIAALGVIERFAEKTKTVSYIKLYEEAVIFGGIFGCLDLFADIRINIGEIFGAVYCFFTGIFVGALAVSLAEVLDVVPVFMRRTRLKTGMAIFITALALGKTAGAILNFMMYDYFR